MGIGESDWLAEEYRREGRVITSEAARRLAKEHLLDCDSHQLKRQHQEDCAASQLKRDSRKKTAPPGRKKPVEQEALRSGGSLLELLRQMSIELK